ncbi:MAG: bacterioferritin-associated ferredoxin [Pseudoxanthomonas sp.]
MYVCVCNGVTEHHIREAADHGCRSVAELTMRTGCGTQCGSCLQLAAELLDQHRRRLPLPMLHTGLAAAA